MAKKKKQHKKNAGPPKALVRLSQCMIVKNEEQNIEKALSWGRKLVYEQIVVDTGSSDKTAGIAQRMGAKVFHFEWINDFAAAKNFAIEKASGNWIAFLDADEYLTDEDAKHLLYCLKKITEDHEMKSRWFALNFPWAHLDENGEIYAVQDQERVFRSFLRYKGRVHERLDVSGDNVAHIDELTIMHTGYARGEIDRTQKAQRNIGLLRAGLIDNPDDINSKVFLGDSLQATNEEKNLAEAEELFYEAIYASKDDVMPALRRKAYNLLTSKYNAFPAKTMGREQLCRKALREFPGDIDIGCLLGEILNGRKEYSEAWSVLKKCEARLSEKDALSDSEVVIANPKLLYRQLAIAADGLGDEASKAHYSELWIGKKDNYELA